MEELLHFYHESSQNLSNDNSYSLHHVSKCNYEKFFVDFSVTCRSHLEIATCF